MKKVLFLLSLMMVTMTMMAVPAKRGMWKTLTLADGTEVKAMLVGDEHGHFWKSADGKTYQKSGEFYKAVEVKSVVEKANARRSKANQHRSQRLKKVKSSRAAQRAAFSGQKKGLIILVNFTDKSFKKANNKAKYEDIANKENYSEGNFKGSMADYFKAQSGGDFELNFDVVGPVTVKNKASYYGENAENGNDKFAGQMVCEAVALAMEEVTEEQWKSYDWDGDKYVDQVYVVYAGKGEADGGEENTIWPHAYDLQSAKAAGDGTGRVKVADNLYVNTYACGAELDGYSGQIAGIGTMCHEFSHCMGFPDFYDTSYSGWFGMGSFDLMCSGSYNGDGYVPSNYTAYEKMVCGWLELTELTDDVEVTDLKPTSEGGAAYVLYNSGNSNEYYIIENRQKIGWDASLPGKGLMITHLDYDETIWAENSPNTKVTEQDVREYKQYYGITIHANNHERCTIFHADNDDDSKYWDASQGYYTKTTEEGDLYPYKGNNSLTATSKPKASLYNKNAAGTTVMEKGITEITQNSNGTMSFKFGDSSIGGGDPVTPTGNYLFYESFDQCDGTGGNDGTWNGNIASSTFKPDHEEWTACTDNAGAEKAYGADKCAKFGGGKVSTGWATTPAFAINGTGKLTFKAGAWDASGDMTGLKLSVSEGTISPELVTMVKGDFTDYEATITATGNVKVTFAAVKGRFFLDEVLVVDPMTTAIQTIPVRNTQEGRIYTLDGRFVGTDINVLNRGLYIVNGRKVAIK